MKWGLVSAVILLASLAFGSQAQEKFPAQRIAVVAPYPAGGGVDAVGRLIAPGIAEKLGQPVIVENRPGAAGQLGTAYVSRAAPDGYTILVVGPGATTTTALFASLPYVPRRDLRAIAKAVTIPSLLVANPSFPAKTLLELIVLARKAPNTVSYGSGGVGTAQHLAGELLNSMAGIKMLHVPYKGTAPAIADTISGQINLAIGDPSLVPFVNSGQVRLIGVTTARRSQALPDYPSLDEQGLAGFDAGSWYGFLAPAKTPANVVDLLNQAIVSTLAKPDVRQRLLQMGMEPTPMSAADFDRFLAEDTVRWTSLIKAAGIKAE